MHTRRLTAVLALLITGPHAWANSNSLPFGDDNACMQGPLAQFGQYIGDWTIEDWRLSQDGKSWSEGNGAHWNFACLGNGTAVQDFWMPNGVDTVGTNLRTYNADTGTWDIAWATSAAPGFAHISAKEDAAGNIVMHYVSPLSGPARRITFFPPDESGWNWKLEFSSDDGETWTEVYRIRATRSE